MSIPIIYPYAFFLLFVRFLAFFAVAPLFSQRSFPIPGKIGLAGLLAFLLTPLAPVMDPPTQDLLFFLLIGQEIVLGLLMGFAALLPLLAIGLVGRLVASSMGMSYATSVSPLFEETAPPLGQFYLQFALLLFLAVRADQVVLLALKRLVDLFPPGQMLSTVMVNAGDLLVGRLIVLTSRIWAISLQMALPAMGAILLADLALVLVSRAMPRMNAFSQSLPLKILMGLLVIVLSFPYFWPQIAQEVDRAGQQMLLLFR